MEKISLTLMIYFLASATIAIPTACGIAHEAEAVQKCFGNLPYAKEKLTKLHLYFHDTVGGKNPSVITVAQATSLSHPLLSLV
ncbi:hypothetical protein ACS0TY_005427 [Phlomoides rotata]